MVGKNPSAARNQVWKRMNEFTGYTGDKPFSCLQCDYWCSTSGHLKTHRITQHRTSSGLKKHEITHTGDKPFSCSICDYKCRYSSQLKTHERTSTAQGATAKSLNQFIWRSMKEFTLVMNHSVARIVTTNAQLQAIWKYIKEPATLINLQLLSVWLQMLNIRPFEET